MKLNPTGPEVLPRHENTGERRLVAEPARAGQPHPVTRAPEGPGPAGDAQPRELAPADDWVELKWAEARMTVRDAKGRPRNYVAAAALPGGRCPVPRVRRSRRGRLDADPALRVCPPATLVMLDEQLGASYLFART